MNSIRKSSFSMCVFPGFLAIDLNRCNIQHFHVSWRVILFEAIFGVQISNLFSRAKDSTWIGSREEITVSDKVKKLDLSPLPAAVRK